MWATRRRLARLKTAESGFSKLNWNRPTDSCPASCGLSCQTALEAEIKRLRQEVSLLQSALAPLVNSLSEAQLKQRNLASERREQTDEENSSGTHDNQDVHAANFRRFISEYKMNTLLRLLTKI